MLIVDVRTLVGVEGRTVRADRCKKGVIGIEHLSSENLIPFPCKTAGVNTFLSLETNVESRILDFFAGAEAQRPERIEENQITPNVEGDCASRNTLSLPIADLANEVVSLVVKLKNFGIVGQHLERAAHKTGLHMHEVVENLAMVFGEFEE